MSTQYEVLDTISIPKCVQFNQSFTNKEGFIFILDYHGKVYVFDPFGAKQPTEVQNLRQD